MGVAVTVPSGPVIIRRQLARQVRDGNGWYIAPTGQAGQAGMPLRRPNG